tara:strand:- start:467 stop:1402 length:936 start_codon:yes stop_codon:yes gene_type:complete
MKSLITFSFLFIVTTCFAQNQIALEEIQLKNDSVVLPGTLSYNKELQPQPLAIFIHGSGGVDRNGNQGPQFQANYIKQLSEALNKNNIAFYRYDKRTATMSNMKFIMKELTFDKFIEDAKIVINKFKNDPRFSSITLIGHSQGSLVAMLASDVGVDNYISLAGASKAFDITITKQIRIQNGDSLANIAEHHFKELRETGNIAEVNPSMLAVFSKPNLPFIKTYAAYEPTEEIKKINIPTLILNGTKDIQIFEEDANNLHKAKPDAKLVIIENMNHVLKTITKEDDNKSSYTTPDFPISEELVNVITTFIKQ